MYSLVITKQWAQNDTNITRERRGKAPLKHYLLRVAAEGIWSQLLAAQNSTNAEEKLAREVGEEVRSMRGGSHAPLQTKSTKYDSDKSLLSN